MLLSVIVPCFNEEAVIAETNRRLHTALEKLCTDFEIIYVDDGSRDATRQKLKEIRGLDCRVKSIHFSRNFGHQMAVTAGLDHSLGDAVVVIDADLQDPPELIPEMIAKWREGYQIVYGQRERRDGDSAFKRWTAYWFYRILGALTEIAIPVDTGDFRLLDRKVVNILRTMPERHRFLRGIVSWVGFRQYALKFHRDPRFAGETKYALKKMLKLATDGVFSFSTVPLRLAVAGGIASGTIAFFSIIYALALRLFTSIWVTGWTMLFIAISFFSGVQLIFLGIIGEYIGRIFNESKQRPLYIIDEVLGFDDQVAELIDRRSQVHLTGRAR